MSFRDRISWFPWLALPAAVCACALAGCAKKAGPVIPRAAFLVRETHRQAVEGRDTTIARLVYPDFVGARTGPALDSLRATVHALLVAPAAYRKKPASSPAGLMDGFVADWDAARKARRRKMYWRLDRRVEVVGETLGVVSLACSQFEYAGGAHPMTTLHYLMLGEDDGRRVRFADVFRGSVRESLGTAVEPFFRKARGLAADSSLAAAGFTFPGGRFVLNDDFAIAPDGVRWHFEPYEIAAYVFGPTDFVVPFDVARPFANPAGPLGGKRP